MTIVEKLRSNPAAGQDGDWDAIRQRFLVAGDAAAVLASRNEIVEGKVVQAYRDHLAPMLPEGMAVLAVGGFGRRELFPCSDVDVLLLVEKQPAAEARNSLSEFLREVWDSDLRLSHSVRTPKECCEVHDQNVELNISLLDQRFLVGDRALYDKLAERLPRFLHGQRAPLIRHLCELTRPRHRKYQNTIYHLEPNVKETPGGLRDLHLLEWLDKLRDDSHVASEWLAGLEPSREFLGALRCFLHFRADRDDNTLSFAAQEDIAEQPFLPFDNPEDWMRQYFFHARSIHRSAIRAMDASEGRTSSLFKGFRAWRTRLSNAEFTVSRERVFFKAPQSIPHDPELVMRLFQFVGRHGLKLALETERRVRENLPAIESHYAQQGPHWPALLEILTLPRAARALAAMHETAVLGAVLPEWKRIECLVTRDFYHRYTVDEHTILTIQSLDDLSATEDRARKRFAGLLGEVEHQDVLRLALVLHDIGKGDAAGSHAERSVALANQAMERMQLPIRKRNMVRFLIERHLDLSTVMTSRDLEDPSTARLLADTVQTIEKLKHLVLLTYADISAVNPAAMTPWRMEQLWMVYLAGYKELTRELEDDRIIEPETASPEKAALPAGFPNRYLRT
ncbi:MAG: hypothetical protein GY953_42080, partial [bacterium]|nr:hypothetical protein [bacterium]